jgi:hypothetical protein
MQIVYKIAASDNKDPLIAQRGKPPSDLIVKLGRLRFVKAQLDHWDVGPKEDMTEHGPGPMVEPPLLVTAHRDRHEQMLDATGKDRIDLVSYGLGDNDTASHQPGQPASSIVQNELY